MAGDDVTVKFGAEIAGLKKGTAAAAAAINDLKPPIDEFADLSARQVGSIASLFNRLGSAIGVSLGPVGAISIELVRASQHFRDFAHIGEAMGALGETLRQAITNPLTLAVGAFATAAIGGKLFFDALSSGLPTLEKALEKHKALVEAIGRAYGDAGKAATDFSENSRTALQLLSRDAVEYEKKLLALSLAAFKLSTEFSGGLSYGPFGTEHLAVVDQFLADIDKGTADVLTFRETLRSISLSSPAGSPLREFVDYILSRTEAAAQSALRLKGELAAAVMTGQSAPTVGAMVPRRGDLFDTNFNAPSTLPPDNEAKLTTAIDNTKKQTEALRAQITTFNQTTIAAQSYRKEQELIADAVAAHITLGPKEKAAIHAVAQEYGLATAQLESLNKQQQGFEDIAHSIVGAFSSWMSGTDSLTHALLLMTLQLAQAVVEAILFKTIMAALGMPVVGGGSGAGGFLAGLLGFGGGRAGGGPLDQGKWYIAGEYGPEPVWGGGQGAFAAGYGGQKGGGGGDMDMLASKLLKGLIPHLRSNTRASKAIGRTLNTRLGQLMGSP